MYYSKDALAEFLSFGLLQVLLSRPPPLYLSDFHHQPQRRVLPLSFRSRLLPSLLVCMPADIIPSASTALSTATTSSSLPSSSSSSINAQFINAVTRGDEPYARSLLARGADVNATDAVGRSAVACAVAGERYAERARCSRACMEMRC
jgi:hypothetical protein